MPPIPKKNKTVGNQGPTIRLALAQGQAEREGNQTLTGPSGHLALGADVCKTVGPKALGPTVRLVGQCGGGINTSVFPNAFRQDESREDDTPVRPALLVSYYYLEGFLDNKHRYHYRDWVMDSGAFSAHNSGVDINLEDYIAKCKELKGADPTLTEIFALDVIGCWKGTKKNTERMWKKGIEAIPCFHYGEPWDVLLGYCKDYPKVAIGGCVGRRDKDKFAAQCFTRVWPKKLHGFGFGSEKSILLLPWHSVDATNWEIGPCKYGSWRAFGRQRVSVRGSKQNLRAEVEWYLELERRARERWKKEMALLEGDERLTERLAINGKGQGETNGALGPIVRLAADPNSGGGLRLAGAVGPTVRLVQKESGREQGKGLKGKKR